RGDVFNKLKRYEEAVLADAEVLKIDPQHPFTKGRLLHHKMLSCDWREIDDLIAEIDQDVAARRLSAEPFGWQGIAESPRSLKLCAELFNSERYPSDTKTYFLQPSIAINHRRIRIAYSTRELHKQDTSKLLAHWI